MSSTKQPPKPKPEGKTKTVVATKAGHFVKLREPGDEFEVPATLNASWFVDAKTLGKDETAGDLV